MRIRALRGKRTVRELLKASGVRMARETWSRYENGRVKRISYWNIEKVAEALRVAPAELTGPAAESGSASAGGEGAAPGTKFGDGGALAGVSIVSEPGGDWKSEIRQMGHQLSEELARIQAAIDALRSQVTKAKKPARRTPRRPKRRRR